jgi:hypothetical protein
MKNAKPIPGNLSELNITGSVQQTGTGLPLINKASLTQFVVAKLLNKELS